MSRDESAEILVCCSVSVFGDALSFGKKYTVLEKDPERRQVRVLGDNGRNRWFPMHCFSQDEQPLLTSIRFETEDLASGVPVEVIVTLDNGEDRLMHFYTPQILSAVGDLLGDTGVRIHFGDPGMVVLTKLSEETIREAVRHIEGQGKLISSSVRAP